MKSYPVCREGKPVGSVTLEKEGLYYRLCCQCALPEGPIYRLQVKTADAWQSLGVLIPQNGAYLLDTHIPVKKMPLEGIQYRILANTDAKTDFEPLSEDKPFLRLSDLDRGRLAELDGELGIVFL